MSEATKRAAELANAEGGAHWTAAEIEATSLASVRALVKIVQRVNDAAKVIDRAVQRHKQTGEMSALAAIRIAAAEFILADEPDPLLDAMRSVFGAESVKNADLLRAELAARGHHITPVNGWIKQ